MREIFIDTLQVGKPMGHFQGCLDIFALHGNVPFSSSTFKKYLLREKKKTFLLELNDLAWDAGQLNVTLRIYLT